MDDDGPAFCAGCGASRDVNWSYAFYCWYCATCRYQRCERELKPTGLIMHLTAEQSPSWLGLIP